jgi:hypothetical protein
LTYAILAFAAASLAAAISGWWKAWSARGEANAAAERARIAETRADAERAHAFDAQAAAAVALAQLKGAQLDLAQATQDLVRARAEKGDLLEQIAKLGVPVGDALYDSTVDRLYADRDRREAGRGASAGAGPSSNGVPVVPAGPAAPAPKG